MVQEQLVLRGIKNQQVLNAFLKVQRDKFVPAEVINSAYEDHPIAIGEGQTISQPYMVALMTEYLELSGKERVLEIGTGSGYQTAILAELAAKVHSIERFPSLAESAKETLNAIGYKNIEIRVGDGTLGWPELGTFNRIIITAASSRLPLPLSGQLAENGIAVLPVGESFSQILQVIRKKHGVLEAKDICNCVFVPLVGKFGLKQED